MTASQVFRATLVVILTVVTAYILFLSLHIVVVLLVAIIMASAMRPAVLWLQKHRLPEPLGILVPYLAILLVSVGLFVIVLPPAVERLGVYIENDDRLAAKLISANRWAETSLENIFHPADPVILFDPDSIRNTVSSGVTSLRRSIPAMAGEAGGLLGDLVLVIVIGIYWLTSRDQAVDFTLQLFSGGKRPMVKQIILEIEQALGAYVRGLMLVVLFV
ncbi:MAG: AI-2E family transporter, partial [Chloroflexota bacterium]